MAKRETLRRAIEALRDEAKADGPDVVWTCAGLANRLTAALAQLDAGEDHAELIAQLEKAAAIDEAEMGFSFHLLRAAAVALKDTPADAPPALSAEEAERVTEIVYEHYLRESRFPSDREIAVKCRAISEWCRTLAERG